jgi:hypothetical protein
MQKFQLVFLAAVAIASVYGDEATNTLQKWKTQETAGVADRDKLLDELFAHYKAESYPENSTVKFGLSILNVDFCTDHNLMNTNVWLRMSWDDNRLTWDAKERGISVLRLPPAKVWTPDMTLYNGVNPKMDCYDSNVLVYPNGHVLWVPPCTLKSYCNLTIEEHPMKEQVCTLKFGSWTFDGLTMGLDLWQGEKFAGTDDYFGRKYRVTKNEAVKQEKFYDCCVEPYLNVLFTVGFTRQTEADLQCPH